VSTNGTKKRITIIGTGLIGGSIGLALRAANLQGVEIVGHDRERGNAAEAQKRGAIDRAEHNLPRSVEGAGMVIIATPVLAVRETMVLIAPDLGEGAVVTDTASTKAHVMKWAGELLPPHVSFVGGHPMAGKENQGIEHADANLFRDRAYCICPSVDAPESAVRSVMGMAQLIGAEPLFLDAEEHDVLAAAVSHLPLMVSTALFNLVRSSPSWDDMGVMASSGFRDVTRLASGDPRMSHDIWVTNREAVIHWLDRMSGELQRFRTLLQDAKDEELLDAFAGAQLDRDAFLTSPPRREQRDAGASPGDTRKVMMDMLVGGMMGERMRKLRELAVNPPPMPERGEEDAPKKKRMSIADRIADGVRRDLEKMERARAEKEAKQQRSDDS
jgi:prephenate dehydrogenase